MQEFLSAIQSGASGDELAADPAPRVLPGRLRPPRRGRDVRRASNPRTRTRGSRSTWARWPVPELAPDEAYVAVMASSINFNTVWTSIFEPLPTFGFLDRLGKESRWGKRHALDYHVVGSDASGVVLRTGSAVRLWKPGDKVTVHCNYVDDQSPSAHDDSILADNQRIWGFETNFGGLADLAVVKANQLMPKADPPHLGGGGRQRPVQLHLLPDAGVEERRPHAPGRQGAGVGGVGRARCLRRPVRAQRRRHPGGRGVLTGQGRAPPRPRGRGGDRPQGGQLPVLEGRAHPGRVRVAPSGQGHPGPGRRGRRHRVRTSRAARPWGRRCSRPSGAGPS